MEYFLGIDAGATKTNCVLGTETEVLARAQGGSIKVARVSEAEADEHLQAILASLVQQSGVALQSISATCVGLSGFAIPSVADWVRTALTSRVSGHLELCGDELIALGAAFHGGRGILAIAGTGSHVMGRTPTGELVRTGGWDPVISDQGRRQSYRIAGTARHVSCPGCIGRNLVVACDSCSLGHPDNRGFNRARK